MPRQLEKPVAPGGPFRLADWIVEPALNRLSRGDATIQLELKVMDVLVCLAERAGEVVTRQEIIDRVWATEFISDNTLTHAITELRNALGDDARNPSFIETIHRRGYRLIAPVDVAVSDEAGESKVASFPVRERPVGLEEDRSPYPGLAAFTEADAEFFFGREDEVARMWRKLTSRRLLAVIGPSGVGKSSFLRAGVIPANPKGWGVLVCQPGEAPFAALARALVPKFGGDDEAISRLVHLTDTEETVAMVSRWRDRHDQVLFVVDQFEELFTLNPTDVQDRFAALLRSLVDQADVHLLLSVRDDFLYRCQSFVPLQPVLDGLFALEQPDSLSLERALLEPAKRFGYTFEDDRLPAQMIDQVEGERGALPLLAFAIERVWEKRDREQKMLTRKAYEEIGGVGGALARHAESTLKSFGDPGLPIVREIFRNLVTVAETRAVREVGELLSVFSQAQRLDAENVLRRLVDARLLTSFEEENIEGERRRRVEVVHESLLTSWPRLVRWRTQDADAAQLRDQLRQAARTWDEQGRSDDTLWTGSAYREFALWRERYPGGLTEVEEAFAAAMTHHARWRKRRRRIVAATVLALAVALAVVFGGLWRRSVQETRRAEAAKLVALGELELNTYPTAALAWATSSLELTDTLEGRLLALRALQRGPPATVLQADSEEGFFGYPVFSPNGEWLATSGEQGVNLRFHDGRALISVEEKTEQFGFASDNLLMTGQGGAYQDGVHRWWSIPNIDQPVRTEEGRGMFDSDTVQRKGYFTAWFSEGLNRYEWWPYDGGSSRKAVDLVVSEWRGYTDIDATGSWMAHSRGQGSVYLTSLDGRDGPSRRIGQHKGHVWQLAFSPDGEHVASRDQNEIRIWPTEGGSGEPLRSYRMAGDTTGLAYDASGSKLAVHGLKEDGRMDLWLVDLAAPQSAVPMELRRTEIGFANTGLLAAHPNGEWLISSNVFSVGFWPLSHQYPWVLELGGWVYDVAFTPDGKWLISVSHGLGPAGSQVRAWPLEGQNNGEHRVLLEQPFPEFISAKLAIHPSGEQVAVGVRRGGAYLVPLAGGPARKFAGSKRGQYRVAFSPDGTRLAGVPMEGGPDDMVIQVWDLATGAGRELGSVAGWTTSIRFIDDSHLLWQGSKAMLKEGTDDQEGGGEVIFDLEGGGVDVRSELDFGYTQAESSDGKFRFTAEAMGPSSQPTSQLIYRNLETGETRRVDSHGNDPAALALDPSDQWMVTGGLHDGVVRVGPVSGEEPHLVHGHRGWIYAVAVSPDGRWIATGGNDTTLRVWPMPDLSRPPLHTLPYDELVAKLKTVTNLRVVRDEESSTGWKVDVGPFPGWASVPSW